MASYSTVIILIPAYNEENTVGEVVKLARKSLENGHILVVNDGSSDKTAEVAKKAGAEVISHDINKGKGECLKTGFDHISERMKEIEYVIVLDADMQYVPGESQRVLEPLLSGEADFVMGARDWSKVPFRHRLGNWVWRTTFNILFGQKLKDTNCGFIAMTRAAMGKMGDIHGGYIIENNMLTNCVKNRMRIAQVPVTVFYRSISKIPRGSRMVFGVWFYIIKSGLKHLLKME